MGIEDGGGDGAGVGGFQRCHPAPRAGAGAARLRAALAHQLAGLHAKASGHAAAREAHARVGQAHKIVPRVAPQQQHHLIAGLGVIGKVQGRAPRGIPSPLRCAIGQEHGNDGGTVPQHSMVQRRVALAVLAIHAHAAIHACSDEECHAVCVAAACSQVQRIPAVRWLADSQVSARLHQRAKNGQVARKGGHHGGGEAIAGVLRSGQGRVQAQKHPHLAQVASLADLQEDFGLPGVHGQGRAQRGAVLLRPPFLLLPQLLLALLPLREDVNNDGGGVLARGQQGARQDQRAVALGVLDLLVHARAQQRAHRLGVVAQHGVVQGAQAKGIRVVGVHARANEEEDGVHVAKAARAGQGIQAAPVAGVDAGPRRHQQLEQRHAPALARQHERRGARL